jgi:hypothetical protein
MNIRIVLPVGIHVCNGLVIRVLLGDVGDIGARVYCIWVRRSYIAPGAS